MTKRKEIIVYDTFYTLKELFYIGFTLYCESKYFSTCLDHVKTFFDTLYSLISNTSCIANCCHMLVKDFLKIFDKIFFHMARIM